MIFSPKTESDFLSISEESPPLSASVTPGALQAGLQLSAREEDEATYSHVKPQVLLLFKEKIQDKLPHEIWIARVVDHLRPAKLHTRGETSQRKQ